MINISNPEGYSLKESFLEKIVKTVLAGEGWQKPYCISVAFVSSSEMKRLNKEYYKRERLSDVLSFQGETGDFPKISPETDLGEIVICSDQVKVNARSGKNTFQNELSWVLIHGLLHLLGYEHEEGGEKEKLMRDREVFYLKQLDLKVPKK